LKYIVLSDNSLTFIPFGLFATTTSLQSLDLSRNQLLAFNFEDHSDGLVQLKELFAQILFDFDSSFQDFFTPIVLHLLSSPRRHTKVSCNYCSFKVMAEKH
jgi:hypothetical protein